MWWNSGIPDSFQQLPVYYSTLIDRAWIREGISFVKNVVLMSVTKHINIHTVERVGEDFSKQMKSHLSLGINIRVRNILIRIFVDWFVFAFTLYFFAFIIIFGLGVVESGFLNFDLDSLVGSFLLQI
jgi:hypothetical protein